MTAPGTPRPLSLAVGAVSRAAVDAACEVAAYHERPVYLVASRGQIGSFPSRPGYVEGWCMEDLTTYLTETGRRGHALVVRDHGGPLQHSEDGPATRLDDALRSAGVALAADVKAGVDVVHLDLGAWIEAGGDAVSGLRRLVDAAEGAASERPLRYEIGVDPQAADVGDPAEVRSQLATIRRALPDTATVSFVVVQCGTLVREDRNVGVITTATDVIRRRLAEVVSAARDGGLQPKAHNCDYLSPWALRTLGRAGVVCNIAPQYAVVQNRLLAWLLDMHADEATAARVADAVHANGGWRRWIDRADPPPDRVIELGAHYAMSEAVVQDALTGIADRLSAANLPGFEELTRRALRQLMLQHIASLEGLGAPCH